MMGESHAISPQAFGVLTCEFDGRENGLGMVSVSKEDTKMVLRLGSLTGSFRRNPRGGIEEKQYLLLVEKVASVILSNSNDRWTWSLDFSGEFSVKSARIHIDDILLPSVGSVMRWVHAVQIKINVFAWKVCLDILPTRFNLSL
ncbi:hypothetical protein Tco_1072163 [Tanacetum coccineum]